MKTMNPGRNRYHFVQPFGLTIFIDTGGRRTRQRRTLLLAEHLGAISSWPRWRETAKITVSSSPHEIYIRRQFADLSLEVRPTLQLLLPVFHLHLELTGHASDSTLWQKRRHK